MSISNLGLVSSGAILSQLTLILATPIITRIYSPGIYGEAVNFIILINLIIPLTTLTYPFSLSIETNKEKARNIFKTTGVVILILGMIWSIGLSALGEKTNLTDKNFMTYLLLILPLAGMQLFEQLSIFRKKYLTIALIGLVKSISFAAFAIILGKHEPSTNSLLFAYMASFIITNLYMVSSLINKKPTNNTKGVFSIEVLKENIDFPLYRAPQVLLNVASNGLPLIALSLLNTSYSGFFALAEKILRAPIVLISRSIIKVYLPIYASMYEKDGKNFKLIIQKHTLLLLATCLPFFLILMILGGDLFSIFFGEEWREAGIYSSILTPVFIMAFINTPSTQALVIIKKQKTILKWEAISILIKILIISIAISITSDGRIIVATYACASFILYLSLMIIAFRSI